LRPGSQLTTLGSTRIGKTIGLTTNVKHAPSSKSSPAVNRQLLQAVFHFSQSSKCENTRQTTASGAWMCVLALMIIGFFGKSLTLRPPR
jgi:hypothetical protein